MSSLQGTGFTNPLGTSVKLWLTTKFKIRSFTILKFLKMRFTLSIQHSMGAKITLKRRECNCFTLLD